MSYLISSLSSSCLSYCGKLLRLNVALLGHYVELFWWVSWYSKCQSVESLPVLFVAFYWAEFYNASFCWMLLHNNVFTLLCHSVWYHFTNANLKRGILQCYFTDFNSDVYTSALCHYVVDQSTKCHHFDCHSVECYAAISNVSLSKFCNL